MRWPSPWGEGFPGWHMECSAMSEKYLGKKFDIHGGGMDLLFPHHEAEIAQSNASNNCAPVNYWIHNNMITIDGKKMGKSLDNFITLNEFFSGKHKKISQAYSPMTIRFFILQAHYRSTLDFSNEALQAAEKGCLKLLNSLETLGSLNPSKTSSFNINQLEHKCYDAMNDDFNTPILIAHLFEGVKIINSVKDENESLTSNDIKKMKSLFKKFIIDILGFTKKDKEENNLTKEIMDLILRLRKQSKSNKDWVSADLIREGLDKLGIEIQDSREGTKWKLKN